jgi:hypothetical protein
LEIEMDSPIIATIQALLLLSAHEAAQMRDTRGRIKVPFQCLDFTNVIKGWLYCGEYNGAYSLTKFII